MIGLGLGVISPSGSPVASRLLLRTKSPSPSAPAAAPCGLFLGVQGAQRPTGHLSSRGPPGALGCRWLSLPLPNGFFAPLVSAKLFLLSEVLSAPKCQKGSKMLPDPEPEGNVSRVEQKSLAPRRFLPICHLTPLLFPMLPSPPWQPCSECLAVKGLLLVLSPTVQWLVQVCSQRASL